MTRRLFTGPNFSALESMVFDDLVNSVGNQPGSILYIAQREHPTETTTDRWCEYGPSAALQIDTFDGVVSEYYEQDQFKGPATNIDKPLLDRLVELGVEHIDSPTNPLHTGERFPSSGLIQEAQTLFTELEFAGLLSPADMRTRLQAEGLGDRAVYVEELAEAIESSRRDLLADSHRETYRSERMHHVTTASTPFTEVFPSVDAVVISGFTQFSRLQTDLLERIINTWPTVALLPKQINSDSALGVDAGARRALDAYLDLGFTREHHAELADGGTESRHRITQSLYRHPSQSPDISDIPSTTLDIESREPETLPDEVRNIARDIRARIAEETPPEAIGVALPAPVQYSDQIREVFETYEIPFTLHTELALPDTALGDIVQTVCQLAQEPRSVDSLLTLLTNPLVHLTDGEEALDHRALTRVAARLDTNSLSSALVHIDDDTATSIESLLADIDALRDVPIGEIPQQLERLFDHIGVTEGLSGDRDLASSLLTREQQSAERLDRILETLELTEPLADPAIGDSVDRLQRALQSASIQLDSGSAANSVVITSFDEAILRSFEHVYVPGLTSTHFPAEPDKPSFTEPIYEAHPDFEQTDIAAEARYRFSLLFSSEAALHLSAPQRSVSGDPFVEADVLTELQRLIDLNAVTVESTDGAPGCQEDVHHTIGEILRTQSVDQAHTLIDNGVAAGTLSESQATRLKSGIVCATARSSDDLTLYDGNLTAETVSQIHDSEIREPYSPSRLETYAACGFKYYMQNVLEIDSPESLTREPDAGARGSYIHNVLEHYYLSLQSVEGEPVNPGGDFETRQQQLFETALEHLEDAFAEFPETAFQTEWLRTVLAGLGSPGSNPHYGPIQDTGRDEPLATGLFYEFLEHEFDEPAKTTARPAWFEARIGEPHTAGTPIQETPAHIDTPEGTVPIHGLIDRVEIVPDTKPTHIVVRDYKTGRNTPSESDALLGLKFQLQLYTLMVEDALDNAEGVGGAYYQASPPGSVNSRKGLFTSQEMAEYHGNETVETPFLRHSYPHVETHEQFRSIIEEVTSERLGQLAAGIADGQFHPTVLEPSDAGCRYCDYSHVCDVRPHHRMRVIEQIDDADIAAYIPPKARGHTVDDVVEVE